MLKVINKKEREINQDIYIRDIFVHAKESDYSFGEWPGTKSTLKKTESKSYENSDKDKRVLQRLVDQIDLIAAIANKYHQKYYCEESR